MSITEYFTYWKKYINEYGKKTAVLYQKGKFYELYGVESLNLGNTSEISEILNMKLTKTNKKIQEVSLDNPEMMGFQVGSLDRCVKTLIQHSYTVVQIDQEIPDQNGCIKRSVKKIYTPAIITDNTSVCKYLTVIAYLDQVIGISTINCVTGQIYTYEIGNTISDQFHAFDECNRFLETFNATELFYFNHDLLDSNNCLNKRYQELKSQFPGTDLPFNDQFIRIPFQDKILEMIYQNRGILSGIEYVNLEMYTYATVSLVLLLNRLYYLDKELLQNISIPIYWSDHEKLILDSTTISQLHLNGSRSVMDLLNTCHPIGKKLFHTYLLNPITNIKELNRRYDNIEKLLNYFKKNPELPVQSVINITDLPKSDPNPNPKKPVIKKKENTKTNTQVSTDKFPLSTYLEKLPNLERLHRLIEIKKIKVTEMRTILTAYNDYLLIIKFLQGLKIEMDYPNTDSLYELISIFCPDQMTLDFSDYDESTDLTPIFKKGVYLDLDTLFDTWYRFYQDLLQILNHLTMNLNSKNITVYIDEDYNLSTSYSYFKKNIDGYTFKIFNHCKTDVLITSKYQYTKVNESKGYLYHEDLNTLSTKCRELRQEIKEITVKHFNDILEKIFTYQGVYSEIAHVLAETDVFYENSKNAELYNYVKPEIDSNSNTSYFNAIQMRHPLIERMKNAKTYYIPHDISFMNNGIVLFGINSCGKSSLMRSIGVNLILVQAGMYVPASKFIYSPYTKLMTRIIGNDDLHRGLSSFEVEMAELRNILIRADSKTMVLGDEICKGTETYSAISIMSASIIYLSSLNASFLFASHLHQLTEIQEICILKNVKSMHLSIRYNQENDEIIYDRLLREGPGLPIYGIHVAKAMKLPDTVIRIANQIRATYYDPDIYQLKQSKYNSLVILGKCLIKDCDSTSEDTHHIKFQSTADCNGNIDGMDQHAKCNLVPLCKHHHLMVHHGIQGKFLIINGYLKSGNLDYIIK